MTLLTPVTVFVPSATVTVCVAVFVTCGKLCVCVTVFVIVPTLFVVALCTVTVFVACGIVCVCVTVTFCVAVLVVVVTPLIVTSSDTVTAGTLANVSISVKETETVSVKAGKETVTGGKDTVCVGSVSVNVNVRAGGVTVTAGSVTVGPERPGLVTVRVCVSVRVGRIARLSSAGAASAVEVRRRRIVRRVWLVRLVGRCIVGGR